MRLKLEETYLYKLHLLTGELDKFFDSTLRRYADIGLSHFMILLAVQQHKTVSAKGIAAFLSVSPAAVSRQAEIAHREGWVKITAVNTNRRSHSIALTKKGEVRVRRGLRALERHVFSVFADAYHQVDLMAHIDALLTNMKGDEQ